MFKAPPESAQDACIHIRQILREQAASWSQPLHAQDKLTRVETALKRRCKAVDKALTDLWRALGLPKNYSLLAVGGYGRGELFPYSDVDVLVLIDKEPDSKATNALERFCGAGWDIGLEMGHSVRTTDECLTEAAKDITVQTALLESRLICGSTKAYQAFSKRFFEHLDIKQFFRRKLLELKERHARYNDSPYSLEPNTKESPGGLRDLHLITWLALAARLGNTWSSMSKNHLLTPYEAAILRRQERILKRIRYQLHVVSERREDRLVFDVQTQVAESLGYKPNALKRSSEQLMQTYYLAAKSVMQLVPLLLQNLEQEVFPSRDTPIIIDDDFQSMGLLIDIRHDDVFSKETSNLLRLFIVMSKNPSLRGMTARTQRALWHSRIKVNSEFRKQPSNKKLFIEFFKQKNGIVRGLRRMNNMGLLGRYLPPFKKITGQMQHDLFHVYTVDQHTLMVIRNLRRFLVPGFTHEYPECSQLMASFDKPWLLYIAALFHDIAKGRGGDHSALGAQEAIRFCKTHYLEQEDTHLIAFLVKHHLTLSHTAQKKDLSDIEVVKQFAQLVGTPRRLVALYLHTVADVRGTSPKVWNAWKAKLMEDLFNLTLQELAGDTPTRLNHLADKEREAKRIMKLYALPKDVHRALWGQLEMAYFLRQEPGEVAWHTRHLYQHVHTETPVVKARRSPLGEGFEVLVYARDLGDLFSRVCRYFEAKGLSILNAQIHTTKHGYALDSFNVNNESIELSSLQPLFELERDMSQQLSCDTPLPEPVFGRLSRVSKHFPVKPTVDLEPDESKQQYVLNFTAVDQTGLLYSVAHLLARYKVGIRTARIMTLGERIEDSLVVYGAALASPGQRIHLEADLLDLLSLPHKNN